MLTHNQISLTRKALYGIMLLGVFLSAFGGGNLPSVRAQEAGTESPTVTPTTVIEPIDTSTEESDTEVGSLGCSGGFSASQINGYLSCYGSPFNGWGGDF